MKNPKEFVAICTPIDDMNVYTIGVTGYCQQCDRRVHISDTTMSAYKQLYPGVNTLLLPPKVICIYCGVKLIEAGGPSEFIQMTQEQKEEITRILKSGQ